jgi:hypothetical protein
MEGYAGPECMRLDVSITVEQPNLHRIAVGQRFKEAHERRNTYPACHQNDWLLRSLRQDILSGWRREFNQIAHFKLTAEVARHLSLECLAIRPSSFQAANGDAVVLPLVHTGRTG